MPASSPALERVQVDLGERSYDILIGDSLLEASSEVLFEGLPSMTRARAVIVTNDTVAPLYEARLRAVLAGRHAGVDTVVLPDGEAHKDAATLQRIYDALLGWACDRRTVLYALGGGVIGDMTGFAAATYMRGIDFIQVPTTLLSQVDSSVGGKTGINHPLGKNMIGAFHQPRRVWCDLATLRTLPPRELSAGLAEVIKYGPIADAGFLEWVEDHIQALRAGDVAALTHAVRRSCEIKAQVVGRDERESSLRAILNFGHTFGHAIEAGMGYGAWLHGEAVGCGMVMAARLSERLGLMPASFTARMKALCEAAGLPVLAPPLGAARYLDLMRIDKKAEAGEIRFVLIESLGRAVIRTAPDALVAEVLEASVA